MGGPNQSVRTRGNAKKNNIAKQELTGDMKSARKNNIESNSMKDKVAVNVDSNGDRSVGNSSHENNPAQFQEPRRKIEMSPISAYSEGVDEISCEENNVQMYDPNDVDKMRKKLDYVATDLCNVKVQVNHLQKGMLKMQRESNRNKLLFTGKDVPERSKGEHLVHIFKKMVYEKWGIYVKREQISKIHRFGYQHKNIIVAFDSTGKGSSFNQLLFRQPHWNGETPRQQSIKIHVHQDMTEYDRFLQKLLLILRREKKIAKTSVATGGWNIYKEQNKQDWRPVFSTSNIYHLLHGDVVDRAVKEFEKLNKNKSIQEQERQRKLIRCWLELREETLPEHYSSAEIETLSVPMSNFEKLAISK